MNVLNSFHILIYLMLLPAEVRNSFETVACFCVYIAPPLLEYTVVCTRPVFVNSWLSVGSSQTQYAMECAPGMQNRARYCDNI